MMGGVHLLEKKQSVKDNMANTKAQVSLPPTIVVSVRDSTLLTSLSSLILSLPRKKKYCYDIMCVDG